MALIKYILIEKNFDLIYKEMLTKNTCFHKSLLNTTNTCSFNKFFKLWVKLINNLKKKCDFSLKLKKSFIKTGRFVMSIILLMFRNKLKKDHKTVLVFKQKLVKHKYNEQTNLVWNTSRLLCTCSCSLSPAFGFPREACLFPPEAESLKH